MPGRCPGITQHIWLVLGTVHRLLSHLVPKEDRDSRGRFVAMDADGHVIDPALLEEHKLVIV